jgi:hypothetical protein
MFGVKPLAISIIKSANAENHRGHYSLGLLPEGTITSDFDMTNKRFGFEGEVGSC